MSSNLFGASYLKKKKERKKERKKREREVFTQSSLLIISFSNALSNHYLNFKLIQYILFFFLPDIDNLMVFLISPCSTIVHKNFLIYLLTHSLRFYPALIMCRVLCWHWIYGQEQERHSPYIILDRDTQTFTEEWSKYPVLKGHKTYTNRLIQSTMRFYCCLVTKLCLTLRNRELQHSGLPCPSLSPGVCSNSCPFSQ